jgi:(E)-4-hydroxy-3-methylbut-2-enyl-diphosphate synthase
MEADCEVPVIFHREYNNTDIETVKIRAAIDFGTLLIDGYGDGIMLCPENKSLLDAKMLENCMFSILQATRVYISKTEYISCPGCGRTLFDLQQTIAEVKAATSHLKGLKIGIMGCCVNGPGEMADADYGYVGAARKCVNLYKGKTCVLKNIPQAEAVERLMALIG